MLAWLGLTLAATPVGWEQLTDEALAAWAEGPGQGASARVAAAEAAARRVPLGPDSIRTEVQWGEPSQQQVLGAATMPLSLGLRDRRYGKALVDLQQAEALDARWRFVVTVQEAWLTWWTAAEVAEHLDAYADDVESQLEGFEAAVDEGLLAPLALEDLRAESVTVRAEAAAVQQQATVARAHLRAWLGERELDAGGHELHDADEGLVNPWPELVERASEHPTVRRSQAASEAERRHARALTGAWTPSVQAGPMWAPDETGAMKPFLFAGVELPLQPGVAAERQRARGAQAAAASEARWLERQVAAQLEGEAMAFEAGRTRLQRLHDEVLAPLQARQERLEAAFGEGLVTADRVVRARRERHEAEHEQVLVAGELLASVARARATERLLDGADGSR